MIRNRRLRKGVNVNISCELAIVVPLVYCSAYIYEATEIRCLEVISQVMSQQRGLSAKW